MPKARGRAMGTSIAFSACIPKYLLIAQNTALRIRSSRFTHGASFSFVALTAIAGGGTLNAMSR